MVVTIKDVAYMAGVSIASVSRVMSGKPGVSAATIEKIRKVMEETGYRPNIGARGLVKQVTGNIALVFPRSSSFIFGNPFFTRVLEGIAEVLDSKEFNSIISFTSEQRKRLLENKLVDGVILFAPRQGELDMNWLRYTKQTTVVVGSYAEKPDFPVVRPDDEGGISLAVQALHDLGHRRIALVNGPMSSLKSVRCHQGFKQAFNKLGMAYQHSDVVEVSEFDAGRTTDKVKKFLEENPRITGVVCVADYIAMGVLKAADQLKISVPQDLSVIGFGDVPFAEFFIPSLSTMHVDLVGIGQKAAEVLVDQLNGKQIRKRERVFNMEFVARSTTAIPRERQ